MNISQEELIVTLRALSVAINSVRYNPELDSMEVQSIEVRLAKLRDGLANITTN